MHENSYCFTSLTIFVIVGLLNISHWSGWAVVSHYKFNVCFFGEKCYWEFFHVLIGHWPFAYVCSSLLLPSFHCIFLYFYYWVIGFLDIVWICFSLSTYTYLFVCACACVCIYIHTYIYFLSVCAFFINF